MSDKATIIETWTGIPLRFRLLVVSAFLAECLLLAAGLLRSDPPNEATIRLELPLSTHPVPGFSSLE